MQQAAPLTRGVKDQEWVAFVQSKVEGWGWQLIMMEVLRRSTVSQAKAPHPLYKSSRESDEGI